MGHNLIIYEQKLMVSDIPRMMKFWDERKNTKKPEEVYAKSDIITYWICKECGFEWETTPKARFKASDKCPCHEQNRYRKKGVNDFFTVIPDGKLSYDFEANKDIDIYTLGLKDTETKIAWCCEVCGYKWLSPLGYRIAFEKDGFRLKKCKKCVGVSQRTTISEIHKMITFWNYDKNNLIGLNPNEISVYSDVYANWKCPKCGYEFNTQVNSRYVNKDTCPCCDTNLGVSRGYNDIVTLTKGKILYYFNSLNNQGIDLSDYGCSEKDVSVIWDCPDCGYKWSTLVKSRVSLKDGKWIVKDCPSCKGLRRANSYDVDYPVLAQMFDEKENGRKFSDLTGCRDDVRATYQWKCLKCGANFPSTLNSMLSSYKNPTKGCPYCSGVKISYEHSFAYVCNEYMDEYSNNNEIEPTMVFPSNDTSVEWVCRNNPEHVWYAAFRTRYNGLGDCPVCNKRRPVSGQNTFFAVYPELAKMQAPNGQNNLDNIFFDSNLWDRWVCHTCSGVFGAQTTEIVDGTWTCPYCEKHRALKGYNTFLDVYPEIVLLMSEKNDVKADEILPTYSRRVLFVCPKCKGEHSRFIYEMVENPELCPYCENRRVLPGFNSLAVKHPEVLEYLTDEGKKQADYILPTSQGTLLCKCPTCKGVHNEFVYNLIENPELCPYCENRRVLPGFNSFNVLYKDIMDNEYDYIANYAIIAYDSFGDKCRISLWWNCPQGHKYTMSPADKLYFQRRNRESCPYCKGLRRNKRHFI